MTLRQVLSALDVLQEHPDLTKYIKDFYGNDGFMYTVETDPELLRLSKKLDKTLDDGSHSGASWGFMMRTVQGVLNGVITKEQILEQIEEEDRIYAVWREEMRRQDEEIEKSNLEKSNLEELNEQPPPYTN
jgi:uncharacterized membrane protein YcgQ (UPF0703/DUF1980 family)